MGGVLGGQSGIIVGNAFEVRPNGVPTPLSGAGGVEGAARRAPLPVSLTTQRASVARRADEEYGLFIY